MEIEDMIYLKLTVIEAKILVRLLDRAADEFSNHGCNDFDVASEMSCSSVQAQKIALTLLRHMVDIGVADEDQLKQTTTYLLDWQLFSFLKKLIQTELEQ